MIYRSIKNAPSSNEKIVALEHVTDALLENYIKYINPQKNVERIALVKQEFRLNTYHRTIDLKGFREFTVFEINVGYE